MKHPEKFEAADRLLNPLVTLFMGVVEFGLHFIPALPQFTKSEVDGINNSQFHRFRTLRERIDDFLLNFGIFRFQ